MAVAALAIAAALGAGGLLSPQPAEAYWRGGVWVGGPGYYPYRPAYPYRPYYRPYYYAPPPVVVAPPPVYYAPPPVVYAPPPPPVYYPPPAATYPAARTCYAPALTCPMEVARAPGTACYCSDALGNRSWGTAR
jgi:hypothetical protein